jgi:hypothetical protein
MNNKHSAPGLDAAVQCLLQFLEWQHMMAAYCRHLQFCNRSNRLTLRGNCLTLFVPCLWQAGTYKLTVAPPAANTSVLRSPMNITLRWPFCKANPNNSVCSSGDMDGECSCCWRHSGCVG